MKCSCWEGHSAADVDEYSCSCKCHYLGELKWNSKLFTASSTNMGVTYISKNYCGNPECPLCVSKTPALEVKFNPVYKAWKAENEAVKAIPMMTVELKVVN